MGLPGKDISINDIILSLGLRPVDIIEPGPKFEPRNSHQSARLPESCGSLVEQHHLKARGTDAPEHVQGGAHGRGHTSRTSVEQRSREENSPAASFEEADLFYGVDYGKNDLLEISFPQQELSSDLPCEWSFAESYDSMMLMCD